MISTAIDKAQRILLVEDSADDYEATIRAFKKSNMVNPVVWCQSGQAAIDYLHHKGDYQSRDAGAPGMILLDLNMPGLDGRKTLRLIKEDEHLRQIPIVILTTSSDQRDVTDCYRMGANTYIQKPVSFEGLIDAIHRLNEYWFEIALLPKDKQNA